MVRLEWPAHLYGFGKRPDRNETSSRQRQLYELGISLAKAKLITQSKEDTIPAATSTMDDENAASPPNR
jgi:hypothetical protein